MFQDTQLNSNILDILAERPGPKMRDSFRAISFDGMSEGSGRGSVGQREQPMLVLDARSDMVMMTLQKGLVDYS